jgi:hypothetical protein
MHQERFRPSPDDTCDYAVAGGSSLQTPLQTSTGKLTQNGATEGQRNPPPAETEPYSQKDDQGDGCVDIKEPLPGETQSALPQITERNVGKEGKTKEPREIKRKNRHEESFQLFTSLSVIAKKSQLS